MQTAPSNAPGHLGCWEGVTRPREQEPLRGRLQSRDDPAVELGPPGVLEVK